MCPALVPAGRSQGVPAAPRTGAILRPEGPVESDDQPWRVLHRTHLYQSPWRSFVQERVRIHSGAEIEYAYAETPDAVFVVPLTVDGRLALIRQYRLPVRDWVWEIPAGSIRDEPPAAAARRELAEEIGGQCAALIPLAWHYGASASLTSRHHAFLATGVTLGASCREPTELLHLALAEPEEAFARARSGAVRSAESALALLLAEPHVRGLVGPR
jgi:ADP-ribose pyrophosphatase